MANSPKAPSGLAARPATDWPVLHAIVDVDVAEQAGWRPAEYAEALLAGGATFLQIRGKRLEAGELLRLCDAIVTAAEPYHAAVIVNDRVDVAALSAAAGVHVGQDDLTVEDTRALLGDEAIVGLSTHTTQQLSAAVATRASYIAVGPVFGTTTKDTGYAAVGLELVRLARRATDRPIVAIGGVTLENAPSARAAGATMVAVISDLLVGGDPSVRVKAYLDRLAG